MSSVIHKSASAVIVAVTMAALSATTAFGQCTLNGASNPCQLYGPVNVTSGYLGPAGTNTSSYGTITNTSNIQLMAGGGSNNVLGAIGTTTLNGGGTLTLATDGTAYAGISDGTFGGANSLINVNNTIQGTGYIGLGSDLTLANNSGGTIHTNGPGAWIIFDGGTVTNAGLIEATAGSYVTFNNTVNNSGGTLSAGAGSAVNVAATVQGGTLTTSGNGIIETVGSAVLDGYTQGMLTLSTGSTYTTYTAGGATSTELIGTINNQGNIALNSGGGNNATLSIYPNSTLQGGGTLTLGSADGTGTAIVTDAIFGGGAILTNTNHTIQGYGTIGNGDLALTNTSTGTLNANVSGGAITLNGAGGVSNTGLLEATNGGELAIANKVNNLSGNITAGSGSTVAISGTIQGGTLNGLGLQSVGSGVLLDGSTGMLTVSTGSTYTAGGNTTTGLAGTVNNQGNIALSAGGGQNAILTIYPNTTLQGGGTLTLGSSDGTGIAIVADAIFGGGAVLTNTNHTIQGYGVIGNSDLTVVNGAGGTLLANVPGGALVINGTGGLTNNGTMQASAGSSLVSTAGFTNFSGNTLTGGTYNVYGTAGSAGIIQIDALGGSGGEIVNNAATIMLNGLNSNIEDSNSADALSAFVSNLSAGSFTIAGGRDFTAAGAFGNSGMVDIGSGDIFTVANGAAYSQAEGTTEVDGGLTATTVDIDGGTLKGTGTVTGNVTVDTGGVVAPGDSPGTLTVDGDYTQTADGSLDFVLGGATAGSGYSVLDVSGAVDLSGALNLTSINGFNPTAGETFDIMNFAQGAESGSFSSATWANLAQGLNFSVEYNPTDVEVIVSGPSSPSSTPEPGTWLLLGGALTALCVFQALKRKGVSGGAGC